MNFIADHNAGSIGAKTMSAAQILGMADVKQRQRAATRSQQQLMDAFKMLIRDIRKVCLYIIITLLLIGDSRGKQDGRI